MQKMVNTKMHNRFDLVLTDAKTGEVRQKVTTYNIILDQMYTRLCAWSSFLSYIQIGTGTGTLSASRTSLFTYLAGKAVTYDTGNYVKDNLWARYYIRYNPEDLVGSVITEVGLAYGATSTYMVTHSLLEDSEGNPISLTKTADEVLTIYATIYAEISLADNCALLNYSDFYAQNNPTVQSSNYLINYLLGRATTSTDYMYLSRFAETAENLDYTSVPDAELLLASKSGITWAADTTNKRRTATIRFAVSEGNGPIQAIAQPNMGVSMRLPSSFYTGAEYTDVTLTAIDVAAGTYLLPSRNIKASTLSVKVNGTAAAFATYNDYFYYGRYRQGMIGATSLHQYDQCVCKRYYGSCSYILSSLQPSSTSTSGTRALYRWKMHPQDMHAAQAVQSYAVNDFICAYDNYAFYIKDSVVYRLDISTMGATAEAVVAITDYVLVNTNAMCLALSATHIGFVKSDLSGIDFYTRATDGTWSKDANNITLSGYTVVNPSTTHMMHTLEYNTTLTQAWLLVKNSSNVYKFITYNYSGSAWTFGAEQSITFETTTTMKNITFSPNGQRAIITSAVNPMTVTILAYLSGTWTVEGTITPYSYTGTIDGIYDGMCGCGRAFFVTDDQIIGYSGYTVPYGYNADMYASDMANDMFTILISQDGTTFTFTTTKQLYYPSKSDAFSSQNYAWNMLGVYTFGTTPMLMFFDTYNSGYSAHSVAQYITYFRAVSEPNYIKLTTPVTASDTVTASYTVDGIHKTDQYVLDAGGYIQFGEGS